jgi:hypothetical protein
MEATDAVVTSQYALQCTHHTIIFRNKSLEDKYPGGLNAFLKKYVTESNGQITAHCVANSNVWDAIRELEAVGLEEGRDFVTLDTVECEMWRMIYADDIERPFWFETGADWLRCKHWKGKVLIWYDG